MITFDGVRRTDKQTFLFFYNGLYEEVEYFLRTAGVPEHEAKVLRYQETLATYPGIDVPTIPMHPNLASKPRINPMLMCNRPSLLVSYMDPDNLEKKIWQLHDGPDGVAWSEEQTRLSMEAAEREANEIETRNTNLPDDFFGED